MNVIGNLIQTKFDSNGSLLTSEYTGHSSVSSTEEHLVHIDVIGNYYYIKEKLDAITDPATPNTWFSTDPIISTGNNISHQLLIKKNNSGNIVWKTFLPNIASKLNSVASDENGNVFVYSNTFLQQGIGTLGSFMQNYQTKYVSGVIQPNAYVVKLGLQGQLLWGTYIPTVGSSNFAIDYYNQQLFIIGGPDLDINIPQLATSNTWQTNTGGSSVTVLNTQTGSRAWGTYNGSGQSYGVGIGVKVNATGIYISGMDFDPGASYFATPGAYKTQVTGGSDYFLTKLNFTGNRVWGTYFGSDGYEKSLIRRTQLL
ncbi:hypothetical protein [Chryseobacterium sp.]|uniref:hypothetical protein n=1 Tax=Chryseobacterium sp. TaxID=1871047 RepID=UPI00388F3FE2